MLSHLGAYASASVMLAAIELPFAPISLALSYAARKRRGLYPTATLLLDAVKIVAAMFIAVWLIHRIGQEPAWLMFLIPGYLRVHKGLMRISRAMGGRSHIKSAFERSGKPESYDQAQDIKLELAHLKGDIVGWIVGACLVLRTTNLL